MSFEPLAELSIRAATDADVPAIARIYNDAIEKTNATFDTEPKTVEHQMEWFGRHDRNHPVLVLETSGAVQGWAALSEYSTRRAYRQTAELSIYLDESIRGRGGGSALMQAIMDAGRETILRTVIAKITTDNEVSLWLHGAAGFDEVGVMKSAGEKFGKLLDVCIMQYMYERDGAG